ncbi:MAG: hypothetical protein ABIN80_02720 [Dyadobacter sp.]|uniref:hypothetical protein n=1 Tax=Dyadobacter sp. TaxID=1914288 RepID=UPI00326423A8
MNARRCTFYLIYFLSVYVFIEVALRMALGFLGYPILMPKEYFLDKYYGVLRPVLTREIRNDDEIKDILVLGGSVICTGYSKLDSLLPTILVNELGDKRKYVLHNVAVPAHTSMDNLLKYRALEGKRFDLVIYYEAINENRANNVPEVDFREDYSHIRWYEDIELLIAHSEINFTVVPFFLEKVIMETRNLLLHKVYINQNGVDSVYTQFGSDIKTAKSFKKNLEDIISIAGSRNEKLLMLSYASYFPRRTDLTGGAEDFKYFGNCQYRTVTSLWGKSENIEKGIRIHNGILRKLARTKGIAFLDMENIMPQDSSLFCDVCHLSEPGTKRFAKEIAQFIVKEKLL